MCTMRDLPDVQEEHSGAVNHHRFQWADNIKRPSSLYNSCFERCKFKMLQEGRKDRFEYYEPGDFVSVNLPSKEGQGRGDAYGPSIARIEAVFEDARGCCHVALRYFWRWGQIHAGADLHHCMRPRFTAQLFLQKEVTQKAVGMEGRGGPDSHNTLQYGDGCFKELLPAIQLNARVTVLSKADVVRGFGGAHADSAQPADVAGALATYEANWTPQEATDVDSGARSNGFWFDSTFDHTCYKFEAATADDLPGVQSAAVSSSPQQGRRHGGSSRQRQQLQEQLGSSTPGTAAVAAAAGATATLADSRGGFAAAPDRFKRLPKELGLTMGDAFCGLGTVSIAANEVGWQVEFGIDSSRDAMASFRANTAHSSAAPFNSVTDRPPVDLPPQRVEAVVAQLRSGRLALPSVDWLHLSPPCQNVSQKKKLENRVFSGAELRSAVELVELLQPSFVTLEEVPGFLVQKFLPQNLKGELAGYPSQPSRPQHSSSSTPHEAAGAGCRPDDDEQGHEVGCEDDCEDDDEDDQEGEGLSDVAGEEGTEADQAAAAAAATGDSSRSSSGAVLLNPVLLVVPAMLDLGYQLRLCLLNAACYGAPQTRHRVVLLASKHGCQLPEPPLPRYALPDTQRGLPRLAATDTGFICKAGGGHGDWLEVLAVTASTVLVQQPEALPPAITLQEACGDLPSLNPPSCLHNAPAAEDQQCCSGAGQSGTAAASQLQQQPAAAAAAASRAPAVWLGEEVSCYRPEAGLMNCPLPLEALQQRGCRPVSRFSRWARSPHAPHQALRGFDPSLLHDHCVRHPGSGKVEQLLAAPDWDAAASPADGQRVERMTVRERAQLKRAGRRLAADGMMQCVLGHNEPVRFCVHFSEDRYTSLAERRRGQSLPDWVQINGTAFKHREQQVGNAVPYLLAAEVAAAVWQAATGEPGRRPPLLNGPCPEGTGIADPLMLAEHYVPWLQQQQAVGAGWGGVLQACRQQLQQEARALQQQQQCNREAALQLQEQAVLLPTQQVSSPKQQVMLTQKQQRRQQQDKPPQQQQQKPHKKKVQQCKQVETKQKLQQQPPKQNPLQGHQPYEVPEAPGSIRKRPRGAARAT